MSSPLRLFISYSHKDESLRVSLGDHLAALQREGLIEAWHDRKITAGQEWAGVIDANLGQADIILCLVSAGFLASPYCTDIELSLALERHEAGEACVVPVILKPADWEGTALGRLQALPANAKPVTNWSNRDEAFLSIARGIREVVQRLAERPARVRSTPPPPIPPAPGGHLDIPEGPVRHDSPFYIPPTDLDRWCAELDKAGALIRIKSPQSFGKSSLTNRLLAHANTKGFRTVSLNLEATDQKFFLQTRIGSCNGSVPQWARAWGCAYAPMNIGMTSSGPTTTARITSRPICSSQTQRRCSWPSTTSIASLPTRPLKRIFAGCCAAGMNGPVAIPFGNISGCCSPIRRNPTCRRTSTSRPSMWACRRSWANSPPSRWASWWPCMGHA